MLVVLTEHMSAGVTIPPPPPPGGNPPPPPGQTNPAIGIDDPNCPVGSERCACTPLAQICDDGLTCYSGLCVLDEEEVSSFFPFLPSIHRSILSMHIYLFIYLYIHP